MQRKTLMLLLSMMAAPLAKAQELAVEDLNAPFGWANSTSLTKGDSYVVNGAGASTTSKSITLKSNGKDMRSEIGTALKNNDIIVFDGSAGDFIVSKSIDLSSLKNKTIVGINGARLCTQFYLTAEMRAALDKANVKSASSTSGGGTLSNGQSVGEEREYLTRKTLMELTKDSSEPYRTAGIFKVNNCSNIIIRNIKFVGPGPCDVGGNDLISSTGTTHLWVDHCEFTDGIDGNFDITNSSDFVTVSWCTFAYTDRAYDHMNTNLVGSSDSYTQDEDKLNVTFANNIWGYKCNQRMPMARFGTIHLLNNYYNCAGNSVAVNPRKNSEFLVEGNYFASGVKAYSQSGAKSCTFVNNKCADSNTASSLTSFGTKAVIPYKYTAMSADKVPSVLTAANGAGATLSDPLYISGQTKPSSPTAEVATPAASEVVAVQYYNLQGQKMAEPKGYCIEVTTHANGSHTSRAVVKQ